MSQNESRVVDEAAEWMALLQSGHASPEEQRAFVHWRDSHPRHAEIISRMGGGLKQLPLDTLRAIPRETVLRSVNSPSTRRRFVGKSLSVLAVGMLAMGLGRRYGLVALPSELHTSTGERRAFTLEDGSALTLNARTRVAVQFSAHERVLSLHCGELLVDVARDPARPFVVETDHGRMRALGTRFLVQRKADSTRIVMLHSKVEVSTRSGLRQIVSAGQSVRFDQHAYLAMGASSGDESSWTDGQLALYDRPLAELVEHLRSYRRGIIVVSPEVASLRISGLYFLDDTDRTLQLLQLSLPITVRFHTPLWVSIEPRG
ncbi:Protein FecR [Pseudomonas reidholzensis]|uniref:Protein FecR n=1 Tax=Pseudomonas reidholzensis TaxID=1785162 RepID=A0A383RXL2_9PSED|nr:FecR family protein [Pseudomonas reidholzensis]SYX91827.1 Protein FecR [Pseudomonas reidholzensis]